MRPAHEVMAELAASGLTAQQIALVMELSATVAAEARPTVDKAAENKRAYDREYRRSKRKSRTTSYESDDTVPPNESILTPSGSQKTETKVSKKAHREKLQAIGSCLRQAFPPPLDVPDAVWADFLNSPKRKKAGMSPTAYAAILKNLAVLAEHGFPPGEMITLAVERGWTTIKPEWVENERRTNSLGRHQPADGISSTARAAIAVFGSGEH